MKYQAQSTDDNGVDVGLSAITVNPFTIGSPTQLTFTATPTQPLCSTGNGSINISAIGGTSPYYYILDKQTEIIDGKVIPKKIQIMNPIELTGGDHNIKVVDTNGCIEKITP
jgi:hypothetical protein